MPTNPLYDMLANAAAQATCKCHGADHGPQLDKRRYAEMYWCCEHRCGAHAAYDKRRSLPRRWCLTLYRIGRGVIESHHATAGQCRTEARRVARHA